MKTVLNKRKWSVVAVVAFFFTVMQITGYQISMSYNTTVHQSDLFRNIGVLSAGWVALLAVVEFPIWCVLIYVAFTLLERTKHSSQVYSEKRMLLLWGLVTVLLFVCWIPCFKAAYPGFYNYDAFNQVPQALYEEVPYSAHHPLLHTLVMGKIISFGYHHGETLNDGIVLHSIFQMAVCAVVFAYLVCYIFKITGRRLLSAMAFCYYAFFPVIAMFAMSTTKDTIFSILLQLCIVFLYEMLKDRDGFWKSKWKIGRFLCTVVLMCLFRNNGIYIVVGTLFFLLILVKEYRRQCLALFVAAILLYCMISKCLLWALDAAEGSSEEALSVPMQQIARVYQEHGENAFSKEELTLIYAGISADDLANYNPFLSDNIKNYFDYEVVKGNKFDYLSLWFEKGLQYPGEYVAAFLDNTYQAWYPGTSVYAEPEAGETYYFDMSMRAGGERESKAPKLLEFYEKIASGYFYQKIPVVRLFFSIGAMFWIALFALSYGVYRKNKPLVMAMVMALMCCATVFLGPVSLVRYYLVLYYGFPVSIGFLLTKQPSE